MEGWVNLGYSAMHWPGVELTIFRSLVRRPNHYTTSTLVLVSVLIIVFCLTSDTAINREHGLLALIAIQPNSGFSSVTVTTSHVKLNKSSTWVVQDSLLSTCASRGSCPCDSSCHLTGSLFADAALHIRLWRRGWTAANKSWATGESLSKTVCFCCQKSNGETLENRYMY